jgi:hypothetical protein
MIDPTPPYSDDKPVPKYNSKNLSQSCRDAQVWTIAQSTQVGKHISDIANDLITAGFPSGFINCAIRPQKGYLYTEGFPSCSTPETTPTADCTIMIDPSTLPAYDKDDLKASCENIGIWMQFQPQHASTYRTIKKTLIDKGYPEGFVNCMYGLDLDHHTVLYYNCDDPPSEDCVYKAPTYPTDTTGHVYLSSTQKPTAAHEYNAGGSGTGRCATDHQAIPLDCDNIQCKHWIDPLSLKNYPIPVTYAQSGYDHYTWNDTTRDRCLNAASDEDGVCDPIGGARGNNIGFVDNQFFYHYDQDKGTAAQNMRIVCQYPAKNLLKNETDLIYFDKNIYDPSTTNSDLFNNDFKDADKNSPTVNKIMADYCLLSTHDGPCDPAVKSPVCAPIFADPASEDSAICQKWYRYIQDPKNYNPTLDEIFNVRAQMYCSQPENIDRQECDCINATNYGHPNKYAELYNSIADIPSDLDHPYCWLNVCRPSSGGLHEGVLIPPSYFAGVSDKTSDKQCKYEKCNNIIINRGTIDTSTINQIHCDTGNPDIKPSQEVQYNRYVCDTVGDYPPCMTTVPMKKDAPNSYDTFDECDKKCSKPHPHHLPPPVSPPVSPPGSSSDSPILGFILIVLIIVTILTGIGILLLIRRHTTPRGGVRNIYY